MSTIKDLLANNEYINTSTSGRIVSALGGLAIITLALTRKNQSTLTKWVEIGSGAALILRAASGYCPVNKAMGLNKAA
jgi:uncharacterized membrane protein